MKIKSISTLVTFVSLVCILASCQKEVDGVITGSGSGGGTGSGGTNARKPALGTTWTYHYTTYHSYGAIRTTGLVVYKAKNEETIGGETWLNVVDTTMDTTVYKLRMKNDGLYQFTNNNPYLLCKYPASLNDAYSTFNAGSAEDFTVKGVNDSLPTGIGMVPANYYEGVKTGSIIDYLWFTGNAWVVRHIVWRKTDPPGSLYYRYSTLYIDRIVY